MAICVKFRSEHLTPGVEDAVVREFRETLNSRLDLLRVVARISELALACEIATAEALPGLWPVLAAAANELLLHPLASLGAPLQDAVGAHVGLAHDNVEYLLALALLKRGGANCQDSKNLGGLHCWTGGCETRNKI